MTSLRAFFLSTALLLAAFISPAFAAPTATTEHAELELLVDAQSGMAAIEMTLEDEWHIYWKNPGDSGLEAQIDWTLPGGASAGEIQWLPPKRIEYSGLFNYGYEGITALLIPLQNASEGTLKADIEFLICKDICIPQAASLSADISDSEDMAARIKAWRQKLPEPFVGQAQYDFVGDKVHFGFDLSSTAIDARRIYKSWFFPLDAQAISNAYEQDWRLDGSMLVIGVAREGQATPDPFHGLLQLGTTDGQTHYFTVEAAYSPLAASNTTTTSAPQTSTAALPDSGMSILLAIGLAFLGGIVLNVMPCVLPVLSLKALSIAKKSDASRRALRLQGLAYTAGILVSFLVVAGTLIILQQAGESIGWGFQLQSIGFVSILIYVLFLVGLNLSGLYELPSGFANFGSRYTQNESLSGSFFTGVLATIVATPCTAPFMATAIGFALSQPAMIALLVFAALGLGLAFPFLLITFVPGATKLLPKPGAWMERFKQLLAFPIYATVIWLLWVLTQQSGAMGLLGTLIGMLVIGFGLWLLPQCRSRMTQLAIVVAAVVALLSVTETRMAFDIEPNKHAEHESFSQSLLEQYRAEGHAVFVNATAAWCITCKVNERVALKDDKVIEALNSNKIAYLVADWTNRNDSIATYLASFERSGVPLYVFYPADGSKPVVLPQLLTPSIVLEALNTPQPN